MEELGETLNARGKHKAMAPEFIELSPVNGGIDITVEGESALGWLREKICQHAIAYVREDKVEDIVKRARRATRDDCVAISRRLINFDGMDLYIADVKVTVISADGRRTLSPSAILQAKSAIESQMRTTNV